MDETLLALVGRPKVRLCYFCKLNININFNELTNETLMFLGIPKIYLSKVANRLRTQINLIN